MDLSIYKRGQGRYTRLISAGGGALVAAIGCFQMYKILDASDLSLWISTMVPVGLFLALSVLFLWMVNKPYVADFMISAEGEMKKVNWSSRQEIAVSTFIVIAVVVLLSCLLGLADFVFQVVISWLVM